MRQLLESFYRGEWPNSRVGRWLFFAAVLAAGSFAAFSTPHRFHRWAAFLTGFVLYPGAVQICRAAANRWRTAYTVLLVAVVWVGFGYCIVTWGNHQFAAWDLSLMVDVGWRLIHGQAPYRDFVCTLPPGFMFGVEYAYRIFGVRWNAILFWNAIFASITFVWIYRLLGMILRVRVAAFLVALAIECAGLLAVAYWWHNAIAAIAATIFYLSCLCYLQQPGSRSAQISYVAALVLIGMMKPNTALPMAVGGAVLVFVGTKARVRFALLTIAGIACLLLSLAANHVDIFGLIGSYRAAAVARGVSAFGIVVLKPADRLRLAVFVAFLLLPGLVRWRDLLLSALRRYDTRALCRSELLLLGPIVGVYAMFTNGELKDTDFPLLVAFGAVMMWGNMLPVAGKTWKSEVLVRAYATFLFGLAASDLYMGYSRARIEFAEHAFFEFTDTDNYPGVPYFRSMHASRPMRDTVTEIAKAVRESPGPVYMGPALEFGYAAFNLPSPLHLPVWWHEGTSYAIADEASLAETWKNSRFATLIFLQDNLQHTPEPIRRIIRESYVKDDRWTDLDVYRIGPTFAARR
jgi:hypothetical protein